MIEVKDLSKVYKVKLEKTKQKKAEKIEKYAVKDLNFIAEPGVITGLIGENGAGKTTTMRMLATLIEPSNGYAKVNGEDVQADSAKVRQQIGVLFGGEPVLYDRLSARENILYFAELNGMDRALANERAEVLAEKLGMNGFLDQRVKDFSRGMKQKAAIARTIVHDPSVIIFDEPTTGLDISAARVVYDFLEQFRDEGKTILLSSHSMYEVERLCDTVVIMHQGQKVEEGTLPELKEKYNEERFEDIFIQLIGGGINEG